MGLRFPCRTGDEACGISRQGESVSDASRCAGPSYTTSAPASVRSARGMPPHSRPTQRTPARAPARMSHTVSPTNTARPAGTPASSSACSTGSGAGLPWSTSSALAVAEIARSASIARRRAWSSAPPAEVASTTVQPSSCSRSSSRPASGRAGSRSKYCPYSVLCAALSSASREVSRSSPSRCAIRSVEGSPTARWTACMGTWCPACRNASHQAVTCRWLVSARVPSTSNTAARVIKTLPFLADPYGYHRARRPRPPASCAPAPRRAAPPAARW